jgi:lipid-A-disaccharide synthase
MKYYIIAGERSGDLHGANFIKALKEQDVDAEFRCWGGDYMQEASGTNLVKHYRDLAFMGFKEVAMNLLAIFKNIDYCKKDIIDYQPDVVVLIDYAGFNMKIAKFAKKHGIKVFYYIAPKVWAWNQSRAYKIKACVDKMFVILPFEKEFFKRFGYEVDYVGNPLLDAIRSFVPNPDFRENNKLGSNPIIAILPGSRKQEIEHMLDNMIRIAEDFPNYTFVVAGVDNLPAVYYQKAWDKGIKVLFNQTYDLLSVARAAVVTSGTATLETALFEVPQLVCYKTSGITYTIAKFLIKVPYISLVNLITDRELVKELIQDEYNCEQLKYELRLIAEQGKDREKVLKGYQQLKQLLGNEQASQNLARLVVKYLKGSTKSPALVNA